MRTKKRRKENKTDRRRERTIRRLFRSSQIVQVDPGPIINELL